MPGIKLWSIYLKSSSTKLVQKLLLKYIHVWEHGYAHMYIYACGWVYSIVYLSTISMQCSPTELCLSRSCFLRKYMFECVCMYVYAYVCVEIIVNKLIWGTMYIFYIAK